MGVLSGFTKCFDMLTESMGKVFTFDSALAVRHDEVKNVIGFPVNVYVVLTVTDEGADVAAVYTNFAAARKHVVKRFETELGSYKDMGYTHFDELISPDESGDGSAYIQAKDDDFWSWRIERVYLKEEAW